MIISLYENMAAVDGLIRHGAKKCMYMPESAP